MKRHPFLMIIFIFQTCLVSAQKTDTELWAGAELDLKVHKRFTIQATQVFKFNNNITHFKSAYSQAGAKFKINRFFSIGSYYRYIENPPSKNFHRLTGDFFFNLEKKEFPLTFQYRLRYQHEVRISNKNTQDYIRNKFTLNYRPCKLVAPYISFEPFFRFNKKNEFRVVRYSIGLEWRIIKNFHVNSFYLFQKDVNIKKVDKSHIIGLILSYDLKTYNKKLKSKTSIQ